jgi:hypothetical protein
MWDIFVAVIAICIIDASILIFSDVLYLQLLKHGVASQGIKQGFGFSRRRRKRLLEDCVDLSRPSNEKMATVDAAFIKSI